MLSAICQICRMLSSATLATTHSSFEFHEKSETLLVCPPWMNSSSGGPSSASSGVCSSPILQRATHPTSAEARAVRAQLSTGRHSAQCALHTLRCHQLMGNILQTKSASHELNRSLSTHVWQITFSHIIRTSGAVKMGQFLGLKPLLSTTLPAPPATRR